ncbi:dTDP-4-dehydrorhamnose 3,5-epimerase [Desulfosporosinus sp. BICA1-9]|uniref:dTDP-4-dehydrorhamnose 3,5-epimerase n=1 Tax=Desulfosporosinus sp. BICA1-9 TaxID=1531958 RepID=UPI000B26AAC1|nr:dTDP-4-dehydrorhamnose 3,5-epimerase [Desulfosporosinus sp. BICA1-9]
MFLEMKEGKIKGLFEITPRLLTDERGAFIKTYHEDFFKEKGLEFDLAEQYFSTSKKGVIRGMHFQLPPHDHAKLVYCITGSVLDVLVDLRKGSPTFGQYDRFELTADKHNILYIPVGLAHGFCALTDATMLYNVSTTYHKEEDTGIRWDSFGLDWKVENPVLSGRDISFQCLHEFKSPFVYEVK